MKPLVPILLLAVFAGCQLAPVEAESERFAGPVYGDPFWSHWGDGQAELNSYDLSTPRYGAARKGTAVAIFVTETFDPAQRVKSDSGEGLPVMKLNLVEDFPTGIYDYHWMTSTFMALERFEGRSAGSPVKITFSGQEWCGHLWSQLLFDASSARRALHSYFDGEADQGGNADYPADGIAEDMLWFWARGLAEPSLDAGESVEVRLLTALKRARVQHETADWTPAALSRSASTEQVEVPAGAFEVERWTAQTSDGYSRIFLVEAAAPYRIVQWETSEGEKAELISSERMQYWRMNSPEYEQSVERLGLKQRPPQTM